MPPPLPQVIQPNLFHPACTWELIVLMWSVRSILKALHSLRLIQRSQKEIATTKGKLPPKVENMVFEYILLLIVENSWLLKFWTTYYFLIFWILYVCIWFKISLIFNFQIMRMMMGATRMDVLINWLVMFIFVKELKGVTRGPTY